MRKNLKAWDLLLAHAEFAYNRALSRTTNESSFMVVCGRNALDPLDLLTIHQEKMNAEASKKVREI